MSGGRQFSTTDNVEVTHHARRRWDERADTEIGPGNAWRIAEPIDHPEAPRQSARYTRFYEPDDIVLLAHRDRLVTVFCLEEDPAPIQRSVRGELE